MNDVLNNITLILPIWNEAEALPTVLEELLAVKELSELPIVIVDDGSSDATGTIVTTLSQAYPRIHYIRTEHAGKDNALWTGVAAAQTEWMGIMDGDGQYDPQDIMMLWTCAGQTGADAVWGIRTRRSDTVHRKVISRIGRAVKRLLLGNTLLSDPGCGSMLMRRKYLHTIALNCPEPKGQLHCHLAELISTMGGVISEIPIRHRSRQKGTAKYGMWNRIIPGIGSLIQARRIKKLIRS